MGGHARLSHPTRHVELRTAVLNTQLQVATKGYGNRTVFHQSVCKWWPAICSHAQHSQLYALIKSQGWLQTLQG